MGKRAFAISACRFPIEVAACRSHRTRAIRRAVLIAGSAWLLPGCATLPPGAPLTAEQVARLDARARPPMRTAAPAIPEAVNGTLPLNVRMFQRTLFPIIRAQINGRLLLAMIDTGSGISVVDYTGSRRAQVAPAGLPLERLPGLSPGGHFTFFAGAADSLELGDLAIRGPIPLGILDRAEGLAGPTRATGYLVEAIIGSDLLSRLASVTFELHRQQVTFRTTGTYRPDSARLLAAIPLTATAPAPVFEARLGTNRIECAVDTGGDFGLWLPHGLARQLQIAERVNTRGTELGQGVGGESIFVRGAPRALTAGGFQLPTGQTLIAMTQAGPAEPRTALLGNEIWRRYRLTIDYTAARLYLEEP